MSKILKVIVLLLITLLFVNTVVMATDIDMNLGNDNNGIDANAVDTNSVVDDSTNANVTDVAGQSGDIGGTAAPSGVSSIAQENMSFSNILNIMVIAVGVILILFAIAILIWLKN